MKELVEAVARSLRCSEAQARLCIDAVLSAITDGLRLRRAGVFRRSGEEVTFERRRHGDH